MPVFDFSKMPDKAKEPVCTYEILYSNAHEMTETDPIAVIDSNSKKWEDKSIGIFTNPIKRTSFEFETKTGAWAADIKEIDARFVSLLQWLGENHIKVRLDGVTNYRGYCVYGISEIALGNDSKLPNFKIEGLFSHFATADEADKTYASLQEQRYTVFYKKLVDAGIDIPIRTLANSAAIMEISSAHFDMCRPGVILYGMYPSGEVDKNQLSLKPVMQVKANIVHLKTVPAGTSVSYGRKYTAKEDSVIATVPLGYADGFPRPYSMKGKVIVNGVLAPIAGNICMDQFMVDVTHVPYVRLGDEVTIMGTDGMAEITADDIANATGTINYEITCDFGLRLPKVYKY